MNTICEMQRKIDAYESYIIGLCGLIQHRGKVQRLVVLTDTPMDGIVNQAWCEYRCQMNPVDDKIQKNND